MTDIRRSFQDVLDMTDEVIFRKTVSQQDLEKAYEITELVFNQIGASFDDFPDRLKKLATVLINHAVYMYGNYPDILIRVATCEMLAIILTSREYERR